MCKILIWNTAAYMRLSKEDNENMISNSISNQRVLINEYIAKHQDLNLIDYYIDDGYSGTSFNRPAFKRLLEDILGKKVNAIIVKDLSRFGRNHIEVDNYIENIFPMLNVRFISIVDGFDSFKNLDGVDDFIVLIKNLMNDAYAKDISKKVKTALITKKKNGEFVGSYAPYGYYKSKLDRHKFIIDEEASEFVKLIFQKTIDGLSKKEIANILNEMQIETPIEHIKNKKENKYWNSNIIYAILKNRVYTGDLIQQKRERLSYKNHKLMMNKEEDFIITKNHHQAIIDIEQFNTVQDIIKHSTKINSNSKYDIFSGYLKCSECNSNLTVKKSKNYMYYTCSSHVRKRGCNNKHTIRKDILEEKVIIEINNRQDKKIDKLNRKYIFDLINMIYLNQDGSIKIEFKRK